jgi:hypothetical protein
MRPVAAGGSAPSSRSRTANNEALRTDELLAFARELVDPPAAPARPQMTARAPAA